VVKLPSEDIKVAGISKMTDTAGKDKLSRFKRLFKEGQELTFKQGRHDPDRDEESFSGRHPIIF
jgi:hypothetical protein